MYDAHSNITDVTKDGVLQYHYGYDMMNQLVSVDDKLNGKVYNYTYDVGGNLISETVTDSNGTTSNDYEYNNSNWGDVLTSYNGQNITYDEIGNPLTYRDGMSMTWKNGRQLATLTNGDTSISYGYDSDSVRTTKTVNGVKYTYAYLNGQLMYETRGDAKFYYSYDANGILYNVRYTLTDGGTEYSYYYTHNSRGDIVGIYNGAGELKAHYEYDAWGNVISITDNNGNVITNPNHIGNLNPFRYRGYYQDTETGLYYLMSRYYDPITHRFINADGYFQTSSSILSSNMHSYCDNNPVGNADPMGTITWYQMQLSVVNGDHLYTVIDVTKAQKAGYGPDDEIPNTFPMPNLSIAYGSIRDGNYRGWEWRIDTSNSGTRTQTHIHIAKFDEKYSQNIDGSPHDGSTGSPPNSLKKHLKKNNIWDWDANQNKFDNNSKKNVVGYGDDGMPLPISPVDNVLNNHFYFTPVLSTKLSLNVNVSISSISSLWCYPSFAFIG
jgi:RHS repeat-associated protein